MSENTLRVLREVVHSDPYHRQFMPLLDEIDRLGNELKTHTETVHHLIGERTADRKQWRAIEDSLDRAERILAALREPSEAVVDAAVGAVERNWMWLADVIRKSGVIAPAIAAAVAAAEREVGQSTP